MSIRASYDRGDTITCSGSFKNIDGTFIDPTSVYFQFVTPAGVSTQYTYGVNPQLNKGGVGRYWVDLLVNQTGDWFYRYHSSGVVGASSEERGFTVKRSKF